MVQNPRSTLIVGTRNSALARCQTNIVLDLLTKKFPRLTFHITPISVTGEKDLNKPIFALNERGVFVKELEEALVANKVDFVVHSLKDLPVELTEGLTIAATLAREDPRDVLLSHNHVPFEALGAGSRIATSSLRRTAQLRYLRQDVTFVDIRGNIPTRLRKWEEGACDAIVLAAAGLIRLNLTAAISQYFSSEISTPAAGQGALVAECRVEDDFVINTLSAINDPKVTILTAVERSFLHKLGGGCSMPAGVLAVSDNDDVHLTACVASPDGKQLMRRTLLAPLDQAEVFALSLAEEMLASGAAEILSAVRATPSLVSPP